MENINDLELLSTEELESMLDKVNGEEKEVNEELEDLLMKL